MASVPCSSRARHAADNAVQALRDRPPREYRHHDLGFVADLGGWQAVADPLGIPMSGLVAKVVTKGYHRLALPTFTNRLHVLSDWILGTLTPNQDVRLALVHDDDTAEVAPTSPPLAVRPRSAPSDALKRSSAA